MIDSAKTINTRMRNAPAIMSDLDSTTIGIGTTRIFGKTTIDEEIVSTIGTNLVMMIDILRTTGVDKLNQGTMGATDILRILAHAMTARTTTVGGH